MSIIERLRLELKEAFRAKDSDKKNNIRMVLSECERIGKNLNDDQAVKVIKKMIKSEQETLSHSGEESSSYLRFLETLVPEMASEDEIRNWIEENIDFSKLKTKPQAIGVVMKHYGLRADGKVVKNIVMSI